ncbi:MAG: alpha/beta hydrolase [Acidobacteria bacterium]|nr:alpha/beta hydrolase [Acidobacteriota bacterium]
MTRRTALAGALTLPLAAQQKKGGEKKGGNPYPPKLEGTKQEMYKRAGDVQLSLWIYTPEAHKPSDKRAVIVFFFGGGWTGGSPGQFEQHCKHLASRGMVAITADYRVASRHQAKVVDCMRDAKSAVRWVRTNANRLGIDPNRIAAGGGSAGGHLAAVTGVVDGMDESGENTKISARSNAMVLFNPAVVLANAPEAGVDRGDEVAKLEERFGAKPEVVSPYHHIKKGAPPAIIFHGKADTTVPYKTVEAFSAKMKAAGNRCELVGYEGQAHGFFNYGRGGGEYYEKTVKRMDEFLAGLGYFK